MTKTIILDCDPGIDDALAILYALGSDQLELAGITTVAGNVPLEKTTANALRLLDYLGAASVPVAKIAPAAGRPGRGARCTSASVATPNSAASRSASAANGSDRSNAVIR